MLRVVLDTNIVVSALLWGGLPGQLFEMAARQEHFITLLTEDLLAETIRVLSRPKFAERIAAHGVQIERIREVYRLASDMVEPVTVPDGVVRDVKDVMVLGCALGGRADAIVSGDNDLLALNSYEYIPIVTAKTFLRRLVDS